MIMAKASGGMPGKSGGAGKAPAKVGAKPSEAFGGHISNNRTIKAVGTMNADMRMGSGSKKSGTAPQLFSGNSTGSYKSSTGNSSSKNQKGGFATFKAGKAC